MGKGKAVGYGLVAVGGGIAVGSILYYLLVSPLVKDYLDEVHDYEKALMEAYRDEVVTESEKVLLDKLQSRLEAKEEMIREAGLINQLRNALKQLGITAGIFGITAGALLYMWRRHRPPSQEWKCSIDGETFASEDALNDHMKNEHSYSDDPMMYDALIEALAETADWFKESIALLAGIAVYKLRDVEDWWNGLSTTDKVLYGMAIAVAVIVCVAVAWWLLAISGVSAVYAAAGAAVVM